MKTKSIQVAARVLDIAIAIPVTILSVFAVWGVQHFFTIPEVEAKHVLDFALFVAALVGIASLWLAILTTNRFSSENPELAVSLLGGLAAGCAVAVIFIGGGIYASLRGDPLPYFWQAMAIFGLPLIVGLKHSRRIWKAMKANTVIEPTP